MKNWTEEELEKFIKENRDKLIKDKPTAGHEIKFMTKLQLRVKNFIDLTPYLIKVGIVTVIIFIASSLIWYNFFRIDKNKPIIENVIDQFKHKK
jgi:hypothetical protein